MIDLSITKDPEWIKRREELWKPVGESLSEGLRKKEVEKVHHYFMTGRLREGEEMSDGAKFYWFPIQAPEAWDYIFEHLFDTKNASSEFEGIFYFQFGDMSGRALDENQELAMWDYFAGEEFQSTITSRVPVGKSANKISLNVDIGNIAAEFKLFMDRWNSGSCDDEPKWKKRINYFISFVKSLPDTSFIRREDGKPSTREGRCVKMVFNAVCNPVYGDDDHILNGEKLEIRKDFTNYLFNVFNHMDMPSNMKSIWEEAKKSKI